MHLSFVVSKVQMGEVTLKPFFFSTTNSERVRLTHLLHRGTETQINPQGDMRQQSKRKRVSSTSCVVIKIQGWGGGGE